MKPLFEYCNQVSSIDEYLSTKVKAKLYFPRTRKFETIIEFLDKVGYNDIKYDIQYRIQHHTKSALEYISKENGKSYCFSIFTSNKNITNKNIYWLRIYNGGEISKENPVYYMLCGDYDDDNMYGDRYDIICRK
jgi:hypothetical protein